MEEYLEAIYRLEKGFGRVRTKDLANVLGVKAGTVTNTLEKLKRRGFLVYKPYQGARLTKKGRDIALDVIRRHRLAECLLIDLVGVNWSDVHEEACKLEHGISKRVMKSLEERLGHPLTCPHGNPIPYRFGELREKVEPNLSQMNKGDEGRIVRIIEERKDILRYFETLGLTPGATVKLIEKAPFKGPLTIQVGGRSYALDRELAMCIHVKPSKSYNGGKNRD